eukprot:TRINITY_DN11549_c0_g1_i1.p1 TRINITY_DN11549_c0_g1~~TRINITY_DN11549_c0_g1_i1.p1  ORF type:complete len:153 (-),score=13.60 TRINITY_DN11549_c0_g1_i1:12-470(-)
MLGYILLLCLVAVHANQQVDIGYDSGIVSVDYESQVGEPQVKICGFYCGPNWCANHTMSETNCVQKGVWGTPANGGCADSCCRAHDFCCGSGADRATCNHAIVQCIQKSGCYKSVCGAVVWAAMKVVSNWCCGSKCPTELMAEFENNMTLGY